MVWELVNGDEHYVHLGNVCQNIRSKIWVNRYEKFCQVCPLLYHRRLTVWISFLCIARRITPRFLLRFK